jgi:hypothetical protein
VLAGAGRVRQVMGETGIRILVRIMGLLLVALAMQYFVNGLTDLGLIPRQREPFRLRAGFPQKVGGFPQGAACFKARWLLFSKSCKPRGKADVCGLGCNLLLK